MHEQDVLASNQTHDLGDLMDSVNLLMDSLKPEEHGGSPVDEDERLMHKQLVKDELDKRRKRQRPPSTYVFIHKH